MTQEITAPYPYYISGIQDVNDESKIKWRYVHLIALSLENTGGLRVHAVTQNTPEGHRDEKSQFRID